MLIHRASATDLGASQTRDSRRCRIPLRAPGWPHCRHELQRVTSSEKRSMRRTASVTMSKSRPGHAVSVNAAGENDDVELEVTANNVASPTETPKTKSKAPHTTQSAFTIMGLKPSPELVSISMGNVNCCIPSACTHTVQVKYVPCLVQYILCKAFLDWHGWQYPFSTKTNSI